MENQSLSEQIQMWKAVETLQSRASCGIANEACKIAEDMTTILEEESHLNETFLTIQNPRNSLAQSRKSLLTDTSRVNIHEEI